jgi:hypothetical protein
LEEEKQIQIIIDDEIVDSFPANWFFFNIYDYAKKNTIKLVECLEFEGFVAVFAEWR